MCHSNEWLIVNPEVKVERKAESISGHGGNDRLESHGSGKKGLNPSP